jgi:cytidylate kinase
MDKQMIISIGRQCGSGGHEIGAKLAEHYGLKLYDRNIIQLLAEDMGKDAESVAKMEEKLYGLLPKRKGGFDVKLKDLMNRMSPSDEMYLHERGLIGRLAESESFVIVGRGANDMMEGNPNALRLFIYAPEDFRIPRVKEQYKLEFDSEAKKKMDQIDKERREYFEYYTGRTWGSHDHHDLMINSSVLGIDGTVDLICLVADKKFGL